VSLPPFWIRILGLGVIIVLSLWLVNSIYSLYVAIQIPWLANLVLAGIVALIMGAIGLLLYYGSAFSKRPPKKPKAKISVPKDAPKNDRDAAELNLATAQQQVVQIQDEVARQALLAESQQIAENLERGAIRVIVFGTGSVGKTSLIAAMAGQVGGKFGVALTNTMTNTMTDNMIDDVAGKVGASMGTTDRPVEYPVDLQGLNRQILLVDTPGILEAGLAGTDRGRVALEEAAAAAMVVFVVDNDLRQSEMEPLQAIAAVGKQSLLVLNKVDLFTVADRDLVLNQLRSRVAGLIEPENVVAISASPRPVILENGQSHQPSANINPFLDRFAQILFASGEAMVAANILQRSQQLSSAAKLLIEAERKKQALQIVTKYQWMSAGAIAINPLPVVDLIATAAINSQMIIDIGKVYGCQLDKSNAKELALSLGKTVGGLGILRGSIELLSNALKLTIATYVVGKAIQGVTGAYLTRIAGLSFIEYFRSNQDWGDGGIDEVVQEQFKLAQKDDFVKGFLQEAMTRVMMPLRSKERDRA
jgi:uncharacterized protein